MRTEGNLEFKTKYPSIYTILASDNIDEQIIERIMISIDNKNLTKKDAGKLFGEMIKIEYRCINELKKLQID